MDWTSWDSPKSPINSHSERKWSKLQKKDDKKVILSSHTPNRHCEFEQFKNCLNIKMTTFLLSFFGAELQKTHPVILNLFQDLIFYLSSLVYQIEYAHFTKSRHCEAQSAVAISSTSLIVSFHPQIFKISSNFFERDDEHFLK